MTRNLRWWIGGLLFLSTVINYIDRQTLSVLAPYLKDQYHWTNTDFATVLIAFRIAYAIGQPVCGRLIDGLGTRRGLTVSVAFYSTVATLTSLASGIWGFRFFRFLLGAGESANWPGATKATSEWFPDRERAWAVAMFDSGSSVGGAIVPFLVVWLYHTFGTWRPAFLVTGSLGFLWLFAWRAFYRSPEKHPRITPEELRLIQEGRSSKNIDEESGGVSWRTLFRHRQTWGIVIGRTLLDPYWFMVAEWFPLLLITKGMRVEDSILAFWVPFLAADLGNFFGGGLSSWWIKRGWSVGKARRTIFTVFGPSMLVLIPAAFSNNYFLVVGLFAYSTFAYAACSTIFLALPADVFHSRAVASVSGLSGMGAGCGVILTTFLIGRISDQYSFQPIIIAASIVPCIATLVFVTMVRARKEPDPEGIVLQF